MSEQGAMSARTLATTQADVLARGPVMIGVAPNGARKGKADHPALPILPEELAACAEACAAEGATWLHLHVRDAGGQHSLDPRHYREAIAAIRSRVGPAMILQITTESAGRFGPEVQMAVVDAVAPEAASVAVRELFGAGDTVVDPATVSAFLARAAQQRCALQYIVYDTGDLARLIALASAGHLPDATPNVLFVLGNYQERRPGHPRELAPLLAALPDGWPWALCAFGPAETACATAAALAGGHVRVGFENNLHEPDGRVAPDNAALVRQVADRMRACGLAIADVNEARRLLGMQPLAAPHIPIVGTLAS
jgi:uncharacterized protein (DUF849 family)